MLVAYRTKSCYFSIKSSYFRFGVVVIIVNVYFILLSGYFTLILSFIFVNFTIQWLVCANRILTMEMYLKCARYLSRKVEKR